MTICSRAYWGLRGTSKDCYKRVLKQHLPSFNPVRMAIAMSDSLPSYETQEEVMFFDTDIGGVVHNLAYLRMIETCRTKLATERMGMDLKAMADTNLYPVVVRTEVDYKFPATLGHKLTIKGKLESLDRAKFWVSFEIYAEGVERCLITCRQALAMVKMPEGRPQRLPQEWREKWGA